MRPNLCNRVFLAGPFDQKHNVTTGMNGGVCQRKARIRGDRRHAGCNPCRAFFQHRLTREQGCRVSICAQPKQIDVKQWTVSLKRICTVKLFQPCFLSLGCIFC